MKRISGFVTAIILAASLSGCRSTRYYTVRVNQTALRQQDGCFRQCQLVRGGGTQNYLACLRSCPDAYVMDDARCEDASPYDETACMTESVSRVSAIKTILLIGGTVGGVLILSAPATQSP